MKEARACFWIAGGVFAIFVVDILLAKIQVLSGATMPRHLGDTLQFLVLLIAVTFFVAGTLMREKDEREREEEGVPPSEDGAPSRRQ